MSRARIEKKWHAHSGRTSRRMQKYWRDYWRREVGHGVARVPGRLLAASKLRGSRAGRKAGAR